MSDRKLPTDKSERILTELLKIPVNTICCDCGAANPKWASFSLGCFLCVRCCSIHRKMGTHISKVRSVSLDAWTQDDIDTMKSWGNGKVNAMYMPHPERHPPPTSMEGSAMEQYIRSKYERKEFMEGGGNSQPSSRSAYGNTFSGGRGSGHNNDIVNTQTYTTQMSALRAMGFTDNAKNLQVLQSTSGDVPNAIEILCRIGSGPVTSSANLQASKSTRGSGNSSASRAASRRSPSFNNNDSSGRGSDPKETILWNMGFHDSALNKEALRRAGGNPEVAAGILIDDKDKLARAVREKSSSSPLPSRLDPPNSTKSQKNETNLLLDLSSDTDQQKQQQQQMLQQQMQTQNAFGNSNQQSFNQNSDQFGQTHNQLQSIMDKNASILALYNSESNNNANNNTMLFGNNMNNAFGAQQQQQQPTGNFNDMSSWTMNNNNTNTNNNMAMGSAFGLQNSMATGNAGGNMFGNNNNNGMNMGMGMGMGAQQQQQVNPFGLSNQGLGNNLNNTGMSATNLFNSNSNTNNNQFAGLGSPMSPFNSLSTTTSTTNNNMNNMNMNANHSPFMSGNNSQGMNGMGNMGMNGGMGSNTNNNFNSAFGMNQNQNHNNNQNNFNNNTNNPWGNNNNLF